MIRAAALLLLLAMPLLMTSAPALAQGLTGGSAPAIPWLRLVLAFGLCIAIAIGAVLLLRRHQRRGGPVLPAALFQRHGVASQRRISVIETRRASSTADLCLVECDGQTWLIALTPAGATVLKGPQ